jgi:hypothetical protein
LDEIWEEGWMKCGSKVERRKRKEMKCEKKRGRKWCRDEK